MEARLKKVEEAVVELRQDVAVIRSNYVQRSDLIEQMSLLRGDMERQFSLVERQIGLVRSDFHQAITAQTWRLVTWVTTLCTLLVGATWYLARGH